MYKNEECVEKIKIQKCVVIPVLYIDFKRNRSIRSQNVVTLQDHLVNTKFDFFKNNMFSMSFRMSKSCHLPFNSHCFFLHLTLVRRVYVALFLIALYLSRDSECVRTCIYNCFNQHVHNHLTKFGRDILCMKRYQSCPKNQSSIQCQPYKHLKNRMT